MSGIVLYEVAAVDERKTDVRHPSRGPGSTVAPRKKDKRKTNSEYFVWRIVLYEVAAVNERDNWLCKPC